MMDDENDDKDDNNDDINDDDDENDDNERIWIKIMKMVSIKSMMMSE